MKFRPHDYQKRIIDRIVRQKRLALLLDMGTGKTACTLWACRWIMSGLMECERALVIAPLKVAESTWPGEIAKWDDFKGMRASLVLGSEEERLAALRKPAEIYVINRENSAWLADLYAKKPGSWPFGMLIIDESSSFKNRAAKRWKAAKEMAIATPRVLLLTGTPAPNGLEDLWAQIYLIDQGERLGRTITAYRQRYFHPGAHKGMVVYEYLANSGAEDEIYRRISDVAISIRAQDVLDVPKRIDEQETVDLPKGIRYLMKKMEDDYLMRIDEKTITAASAGVVANKLLQIADGAVYVEKASSGAAVIDTDKGSFRTKLGTQETDGEPWLEIHDLKIRAAQRIVEDNDGQNVLIYYNFKFDRDRLTEALGEYKPRILGGPKDVEDWNKGRIRVLLANPASSAFGINLQEGGHIIIWLTPIWNLELTQQADARLIRQGQRHPVLVYRIVAKGTQDEAVIKALGGKATTQDGLIKAVRLRIREAKGNG